MAVDPDPRAHVNSTTDFYELLSLSPSFSTPDELRRAYRQGSRKYHPDKAVRPDASDSEKERAREQWDLFEVAVKLLEDADLRTQYDNARSAREQRKKRDAKNDAIRQAMIDRLEKREGGIKRNADEMGGDEERESRRLAEMGRKAREDLAAKRRAMERELEREDEEEVEEAGREGSKATNEPKYDVLPAEERTIKVRFAAESSVDAAWLERVFSRFGAIDAVLMGSVKNERLGESREKRPLGRGFVQFKGKIGVYDAVYEWREERESNSEDWVGIEDVTWMSKTPPAWAQRERENRSRSNTPVTKPPQAAQSHTRTASDIPSTTTGKRRWTPSFPSFKSAINGKK